MIARREISGAGTYRARVAAAGLVCLAAWEVAAVVHTARSAPKSDDWRGAAAVVRQSAAPNALIVFAPPWIDPVGRRWMGDLMSLDQVARMDSARYADVWEVSVRGARAPELTGEVPVTEQRFGRIRLRHFRRQPPTVTWDLSGRSRLCEIDFAPRKGVLLELNRPDDQAHMTFSDVPLGTELHVAAGPADYRRRYDNRATATLQITVDGHEVARTLVDNESGWVHLPVASTEPGSHRVDLVARVHDAPGPVHLAVCVAAEARTPPAP